MADHRRPQKWVWITGAFWRRTADRVIFTAAGTFVSLTASTGLLYLPTLDWRDSLMITAGACLVAVAQSILAEQTSIPLSAAPQLKPEQTSERDS